MAKRRTGMIDRFPNYMTGVLTMSAANTFTTEEVSTPIPRLTARGGRATIMELLWIDVDIQNADLIAAADEVNFGITLGSAPTGVTRIGNSRAVMGMSVDMQVGATPGTFGLQLPRRYDFQDKSGFGYLLAADAFHTFGDSTTQAAAVQYQWRLFYRFVSVSVEEYIGIVQSQSST